jgi:hypothetical protein
MPPWRHEGAAAVYGASSRRPRATEKIIADAHQGESAFSRVSSRALSPASDTPDHTPLGSDTSAAGRRGAIGRRAIVPSTSGTPPKSAILALIAGLASAALIS